MSMRRRPGSARGNPGGKRARWDARLDVRAFLDHDAAEIAAQAGGGPDVRARADDDVADQHGARMHEGARIDDRDDAVYGVDFWHLRILSFSHVLDPCFA